MLAVGRKTPALGPFLVFVALGAAAVAASEVSVEQGVYKVDRQPERGDPLPLGPVFRVYSESAARYDFVGNKNEDFPFVVEVSGWCSRPRRWETVTVEIAGTQASQDINSDRGAYVSRNVSVRVPYDSLRGFDAVAACNDRLRTLAAQTGKGRGELIADGFGAEYESRFDAHATMYCGGALARGQVRGDTTRVSVWVSCEPNREAAADRARPAPTRRPPKRATPLIEAMEYRADRPLHVGTCPVGVKFSGTITSRRAGTVRYRTVGSDGSKSPVFSLKFQRAETKPVGAWGKTFPNPEATPASSRLAAGPGEGREGEDDAVPDYTGWRRIEIVSPRHPPSVKATYAVYCLDQPVVLEARPAQPVHPKRRAR